MFNDGHFKSNLYADTLTGQYGRTEREDSRYRIVTEKKGLFARLKGLFTKKEKKD